MLQLSVLLYNLVTVSRQSFFIWFLFYGPSTHFRSFWAWSSNPNHTVCGQASKYLVHILSPVNDNCSSWISRRGRMAIEIFSWPSLNERMCWTWGLNSGPLACQVDTVPIELPCLLNKVYGSQWICISAHWIWLSNCTCLIQFVF